MAKGFKGRVLNLYSNFMKYTIKNPVFNLFILIVEHVPILYCIDFMFADDVFSQVFAPLYLLGPNLYLEFLSYGLNNDCLSVLPKKNTTTDQTTVNAITTNITSDLSTNMTRILQNSSDIISNLTSNIVSNTSNLINSTLGVLNSTNITSLNSTLESTSTSSTLSKQAEEELNAKLQQFPSEIKFFEKPIISLNMEYCLYQDSLIYIAICLVILVFVLLTFLSYINPRKSSNCKKLGSIFLVNLANLLMGPFAVTILTLLFNKPLLILYRLDDLNQDYFTLEIIMTLVCFIFILMFSISNLLFLKYMNNPYYFEKYPLDYYTAQDAQYLLTMKIFAAFKISYGKLMNSRSVLFVNLILGIMSVIRVISSISGRHEIINNTLYKNFRNYVNVFFSIMVVLKILNPTKGQPANENFPFNYTLIVEAIMIVLILLGAKMKFFGTHKKFTFTEKDEFITETLHLFHEIGEQTKKKQYHHNSKKNKTDALIDNIMIGHKMKCKLEECILCAEEIHKPDLKTFFAILYEQFLVFEKDFKKREGLEGICIILKMLFLKFLDDNKIHRMSIVVLKNNKVGLDIFLKMFYLYNDLLDEINHDLKNLLTIKYGEIYDELLQCIGTFEEILGFIKSRTEKVELMISKTNHIGTVFNKLLKDLFFLKRNKRIFFDASNMLQIICIIRLLFQRNVDAELMENLEYNFSDFLENIDKIFEENISFLIRYDFSNKLWRIKKVPKRFIDMTKFRISDLIDQSMEKIFPSFVGKNIVKKLEDLIMRNSVDTNIIFKTFVCDSETNLKYVKFDIDLVPNLEGNYILLMHCHFHKRQLLIVDEIGNFVNGSDALYEKMGINAEMVNKSKGKINMYNVFNLPRTAKLEDVKIVSISDESLYDTTKKVFLLETQIHNTLPHFLEDYMKNCAENLAINKEKNLVYLNLFETMTINDVKYLVFTIKINTHEDRKQQEEKEKLLEIFMPRDTIPMKGHTVNRRDSVTTNSEKTTSKAPSKNSRTPSNTPIKLPVELRELRDSNSKISRKNNEKLTTPDEILREGTTNPIPNIKPPEGPDVQTYLEYYNYFYDTQGSASVNIENRRAMSVHSQAVSVSSDLFSFLYIKSAINKKRSSRFENFLYSIYMFNFCLVLLGLVSIIYLNSYSNFMNNYLNNYYYFNRFRSRMFSTTSNLFTVIKFYQDQPDGIYGNYIQNVLPYSKNITNLDTFDFDNYLKENMRYHAENIITELNTFYHNAYNFFGEPFYTNTMNFQTDFIYFNMVGSYITRKELVKNEFGLFSLTSNELATSAGIKTFINISYLDFDTLYYSNSTTKPKLQEVDRYEVTIEENNNFQSTINVYQYLYNYFSVFYTNINLISDNFYTFGNDSYDSLQVKAKALLIIIIVLNIIFVLISFLSIVIYKRILMAEFNALYSCNEDHVLKLKEKFKYVRELIKLEHYPSKVYNELRRMKEAEAAGDDIPKKKKAQKRVLARDLISLDGTSSQDATSTENILNDYYLKFAGAKTALMKSNTALIQSKIEKIKKESSKSAANTLLLARLNFEFELINKFIYFIATMSIFYVFLGILTVYILQDRYDSMKVSLQYADTFMNKNSHLYNYYIYVKLSIMFNKENPYTIPTNRNDATCVDCGYELITKFNNVTDTLNKMQAQYGFLSDFQTNDKNYKGDSFCETLYSNPNDLINYLKANTTLANTVTESLVSLCRSIPILKSNLDSVFTNMIVSIRAIHEKFLASDREDRIRLLEEDFKLLDIIFGIFVEPYSSYVKNNLIVNEIQSVNDSYFQFIFAICIVNIFIDFFILWYIWLKIYQPIINSVVNINLVTDSVSNI
jgi:hypothetical protein